MQILEVKRHLNKPDESYLCEVYEHGADHVMLKYISDRSGRLGDVKFEAGSITYAYYRTGGGYVLWKICGPDGELKGYLFHICREQKVSEDRVEYLDLLLDLWIDSQGRLTILDRDELEACAQEGKIGEQDLAWIAQQEKLITENGNRIITDFDRLWDSLGARRKSDQ